MNTLLLIGAISLITGLALAGGSKYKTFEKMTIEATDIKYIKIRNFALHCVIVFQSTNPTNTPLTIDYIFLQIYLNDTLKVGQIEQRQKITIQPRQTTVYELPVNLSLKTLLLNYGASLIQIMKEGPKKILVKGYTTSSGINFPYEMELKIKENTVDVANAYSYQINDKKTTGLRKSDEAKEVNKNNANLKKR